MPDIWVETVHEDERRDGKKKNGVVVEKEENTSTQDRAHQGKKRPMATKEHRGQERKRAA
jgi:hypothetical protein